MDATTPPRRIVMIEDDPHECDSMRAYVDTLDDFVLVGTASNSEDGLELVRANLPDAVILDLELESGSGIDFLKRLPSLGLKETPFIAVCTNNPSATTRKAVRNLGVDYTIGKYQPDYKPKTVIDTVRDILDAAGLRTSRTVEDVVPPAALQSRIKSRIFAELDALYFRPKVKGYNILVEAILMAVESGNASRIPSLVADRLGLAEPQAERAMQNAINNAWNRCPTDILERLYTGPVSPYTGTPTVMDFVSFCARKIGNEYV